MWLQGQAVQAEDKPREAGGTIGQRIASALLAEELEAMRYLYRVLREKVMGPEDALEWCQSDMVPCKGLVAWAVGRQEIALPWKSSSHSNSWREAASNWCEGSLEDLLKEWQLNTGYTEKTGRKGWQNQSWETWLTHFRCSVPPSIKSKKRLLWRLAWVGGQFPTPLVLSLSQQQSLKRLQGRAEFGSRRKQKGRWWVLNRTLGSSVSGLRLCPGGQWRSDWKWCPVRKQLQEGRVKTSRSAQKRKGGFKDITGIRVGSCASWWVKKEAGSRMGPDFCPN